MWNLPMCKPRVYQAHSAATASFARFRRTSSIRIAEQFLDGELVLDLHGRPT